MKRAEKTKQNKVNPFPSQEETNQKKAKEEIKEEGKCSAHLQLL